MASRILLVDDEEDILELVGRYLTAEGMEVHRARDGQAALDAVARLEPDVVVLDIMLPELDGLNVCREIRRTRNVPILMLSARGEEIDKVLGLEVGADDYLSKPFQPKELVARVRAMLRRWHMVRPAAADESVLVRKNLKIYTAAQRVEIDNQEVTLTPIEFSLLKVLAANPGQVMSRQQLMDRVWGQEYPGTERTVDSHVCNLRAKLQKAAPGTYISAVWGLGYRFES